MVKQFYLTQMLQNKNHSFLQFGNNILEENW